MLNGKLYGVPLPKLKEPREGWALVDRWWVVDWHGRALFFGRSGRAVSPQCNSDRRVADKLAATLYRGVAGAHSVLVPVAFVPWAGDDGYQLTGLDAVEIAGEADLPG